MKEIAMILFCIILNSIAQIFLKFGMNNMSKSISSLGIGNVISLITNFHVVVGGTLYATSFIIWLYVLSRVKLSYAYPFISLSYVIVAVLGFLILDERISSAAVAGIILVVVGVYLIGMDIGS